jgi:hypothetical protein
LPPDSTFKLDYEDREYRFYIVMHSAFEGYLDVKEFMIIPENRSFASKFSAKIPQDMKLNQD